MWILFFAMSILLVITPLVCHQALGIGNIRLSNGTLIPDVNRPAWMGNGTLVATTTFACHNGKCESGSWVPLPIRDKPTVIKTLEPLTSSGEYLTPDSNKSAAWM